MANKVKLKVCTKCLVSQPLDSFYADRRTTSRSGLQARCKQCFNTCSKAYTAAWNKANPERRKAINAAWKKANPARVKTYSAARYLANQERYKANSVAWNKTNPGKRCAITARHRASKRRATPSWSDKEAIYCVYQEAQRQQMTVDHIVPLRSKLVCGLHWEGNLQHLSKSENSRKHNCHWPDMP